MSSLPDLRLLDGGRAVEDPLLLERVEDYLDHLCAPLVGVVPRPERVALREEAGLHLDGLIAEHLAEGVSPEEAVANALADFGEPWRVGQSWVDEWCRGVPQGRLARLAGTAIIRTFAWFGLASLVTLLSVQAMVLEPGGSALQPLVAFLQLVSPIVAGCLTGAMVPVRIVRSVATVVLVLAADTALTGLVMLPRTEGLQLAMLQLVWWLPSGCACALAAAALRKSHRRQRFLRPVG